jgi:hypothetical protein
VKFTSGQNYRFLKDKSTILNVLFLDEEISLLKLRENESGKILTRMGNKF